MGKTSIAWSGAIFAASLIDLGLVDEYRLELNPLNGLDGTFHNKVKGGEKHLQWTIKAIERKL